MQAWLQQIAGERHSFIMHTIKMLVALDFMFYKMVVLEIILVTISTCLTAEKKQILRQQVHTLKKFAQSLFKHLII